MTPAFLAALFIVLPMPGTFEFVANVNDYVETHRRLAAGIEQPLCAEPEELSRQAAALAAAIREVRPRGEEGDIFTPAAAALFRTRIAGLVAKYNIDVAAIVRELPELPSELEYRFVGPDLVLMDLGTNVVVDVLWNALPAEATRPSTKTRTFCDVHPETASCWM